MLDLSGIQLGGQEIMHATHQFFLTQRSLYLLVLNAREGEQDANVEYWLRLIESFGAESPVLVVINKIKAHPLDLNQRALRQKFPMIRDFIQTDCEGEIGLQELRQAIERETDQLAHLRDPFPSAWFRIKEQLGQMPEDFISYKHYRALCVADGVATTQSQDTLVGFLHNLGIALNFKDDPRLSDTHVLNPEWVTHGVYKILNAEQLAQRKGVLAINDLNHILNEQSYPRTRHSFLIDLMHRFELCFRFEGSSQEQYLIPELLGKEEPELDGFKIGNCLRFQYHYNILPEGLMPRFIVRTHAMSQSLPRWRTGVVLKFENNHALIKADTQDRKVFINVTGNPEGQRRLLAIVRSHFEHIHHSIARLEAEEWVPVSDYPDSVLDYRKLLVREANRKPDVEIEVGNDVVVIPLQKLLDNIESIGQRTQRLEAKIAPQKTVLNNFYAPSYHYPQGDIVEQNKLDNRGATITGSQVAIKQKLENITNTIGQAPDSALKTALQELSDQVTSLLEQADAETAQRATRRLEAFTAEATAPQPDKSLLQVTGDGLIEAAKTVGALAAPIALTVTEILKMLPAH